MIRFQGSYEDYGKWYAARRQAAHYNGFRTVKNEETLRQQLKIYEKYYPELVVELSAAAESLGYDRMVLLYEDLASFVDAQKRRAKVMQQPTEGCTIFALHENGKTFVGRNYDWLPEARNFFQRYLFEIDGAYKYFGFSDEDVWGRHVGKRSRKIHCEDAINEHGLYIGLTFAHIAKWGYGLSPGHMIRCIAEHCRTTRQALNVFAKIPCAVPKNFLIADADGDIAAVEHAARSYEVVRPDKDGLLVQTNHCLAPQLQKMDLVGKCHPASDTFLRCEEAKYLVKEQLPGFQFTDLWRILRSSHYVYNEETIWSLALELNTQRFNIYYDTALGQKHTKFSFDMKGLKSINGNRK